MSALFLAAFLLGPWSGLSHRRSDDCAWPLGCATVDNYARAPLLIAALGEEEPGSCPIALDPFGHLHGRRPCVLRLVPRGATSPSSGAGKDVDAFTFPAVDFYYNGIPVRANTYVRIRGGHSVLSQHVECYQLLGLAPYCLG